MDEDSVVAGYDRLLASVGERADEIGSHPVVTHWPHVGSAYDDLLIVGQAVYGWSDPHPASDFRTAPGRAAAISAFRARVERLEPLDWIETSPVRNSPFWQAVRLIVEGLQPDPATPWFRRFAWANLYPAAPDDPPGSPTGPLKEAEDPFVGALLRTTVETLNAKTVIVLAGPYWWSAADGAGLTNLPELGRPLLRGGRSDGRTWVVGSHPAGASRRRWGPTRYSALIVDTVNQIENNSGHPAL